MILSAENIDLFYGDAQALDDVSIAVREKEIVAIVGANGAGKSSLIRTIAGIERPRAGKIAFKGADITGWPSHKVCDLGVGQVAEGRQIFPTLTVDENLEVGAYLPRGRAKKAQARERVYAIFPRLAERRHVGPDYFSNLGSGAYLGVAEAARAGYAALFAELARAFDAMVRVLDALPRRGAVLLPMAWAEACDVRGRGH